MSRPPFAFLGVTGVLAAGLVLGNLTDPGPSRVAEDYTTRLAPVVGKLVVCPELLRAGSDVKTRLTAGTVADGEITVRAAPLVPGQDIGGGNLGPVVLDEGGHVGTLDLKSDTSTAVAVTASGDQSGGLEVEQSSRGADGPQRGYANVRCEPPVQDAWFLGGATVQFVQTELVLVNPYDVPALVRVEIHGSGGRIGTPELDGIVVPPRGRFVRDLARYAPDEHGIAVRVTTVEGRIAPAMRDSRAKGETPLGSDWVPRAGAPATTIDLTAMPEGIGRRLLYLFNPNQDDATVRIQVTDREGQNVPDGLEELEVPAGRLRVEDITKAIGDINQRTGERIERAASIRIFAEGAPILAGGFAENNARYSGIREFSYIGMTDPLTGPALITDNRTDHGIESTIFFAAPDGPARVAVHAIPRRGIVGRENFRQVFSIPQGKLVPLSVHLRFPKSDLRALVVTPLDGSAPVFAARLLYERGARGPLFSVLGLSSLPASGVPVADVEPDVESALVVPRRDEE